MPNWSCSGLSYARFEEFIHIAKIVTRTRLLVSWRSPECFDCLLRFMEQQKHEKIKCNKMK